MTSRKKSQAASIHDRDRIIVRLPDGMRDELAARAEANGRSMTAEVVAAIEGHLKGADRVTQLWDLFEKHRENLGAIPHIWDAVEDLERAMDQVQGKQIRHLTQYRLEQEGLARKAAELRESVDQIGKRARILGEGADKSKARQSD